MVSQARQHAALTRPNPSDARTTFAAAAAASTTARYQYVWDSGSPGRSRGGGRYIDSPVLRDEDLDSDGDCTDDEPAGSERLCYANDANFNVTALIETDGAVAERTIYDAYGQPTLYDSTWANTIAESASKANEIRFCGYVYDAVVGLYTVRYRVYDPALGRWVQRDPAGYVDGMNLHEYGASASVDMTDTHGLRLAKPRPPLGIQQPKRKDEFIWASEFRFWRVPDYTGFHLDNGSGPDFKKNPGAYVQGISKLIGAIQVTARFRCRCDNTDGKLTMETVGMPTTTTIDVTDKPDVPMQVHNSYKGKGEILVDGYDPRDYEPYGGEADTGRAILAKWPLDGDWNGHPRACKTLVVRAAVMQISSRSAAFEQALEKIPHWKIIKHLTGWDGNTKVGVPTAVGGFQSHIIVCCHSKGAADGDGGRKTRYDWSARFHTGAESFDRQTPAGRFLKQDSILTNMHAMHKRAGSAAEVVPYYHLWTSQKKDGELIHRPTANNKKLQAYQFGNVRKRRPPKEGTEVQLQ